MNLGIGFILLITGVVIGFVSSIITCICCQYRNRKEALKYNYGNVVTEQAVIDEINHNDGDNLEETKNDDDGLYLD